MANITVAQFAERARQGSVSDLVADCMGDDDPWLFRGQSETYREIQNFLAGRLEDAELTCTVLGSAKYGYSIAPDTFGIPFSKRSDIDVAIISPQLFNEIWKKLLEWRYPWHIRKWTEIEKKWAIEHLEEHFAGSIAPEKMRVYSLGAARVPPPLQPIVTRWFDAFKLAGNIGAARGHDVEGRLYFSAEHLQRYLEWGVGRLRHSLT